MHGGPIVKPAIFYHGKSGLSRRVSKKTRMKYVVIITGGGDAVCHIDEMPDDGSVRLMSIEKDSGAGFF